MSSRAIAFMAVISLVSCSRLHGCGDASLAQVLETGGQVERDYAAHRAQWERAQVGAALERGDGLRTGAQSSALLRVGRNGRLRVQSDTTIRLAMSGDSTQDSAPDVRVESGSAELEAGDADLPLRTQSGSAVLRPGSRVQLSRGEQGVRYRVLMGGAAFEQGNGRTTEVSAGQSITVGIGMAVLDDAPPAPAPSAPPAPKAADGVALITAAHHESADSVQAIVSGQVKRREQGEHAWRDLAAGSAALAAGDELDIREDGRAVLTRGNEHATLSRGHYEIGGTGAPLVRASEGKLQVSADHALVAISVPGGTIIAEPVAGGSRADVVVHADDGRAEVEVVSGRVKTVSGGAEDEIERGEHTTLSANVATQAKRAARSAEHAELIVPAGESFRVYDPDPPTSIGFNVSKHCADGAEISVEGLEPVRGNRQVNIVIGPGLRSYRVRCLGAGEGRPTTGSVRVMRSDGTRRPPTTPAHNEVDLDGRQYTLMYQNLRPTLDVIWPNAPQATSYTLQLRRPDGTVKSQHEKRPRAAIASNLLVDGIHALQFTTSGAKPIASKETRVNVVFDNAAPTASLRSPAPAGFAPGATTTVSGVTLAGSSASVGGHPIAVDREGRFSAEVPLAPGQRALAVRFKHEVHGIRYYIRRAAGEGP